MIPRRRVPAWASGREQFEGQSLDGISGLHFHTLCEQNADALERTLAAFEARFAEFMPQMSWLNLGGGHHITRKDYDVDLLIELVNGLKREIRGGYLS